MKTELKNSQLARAWNLNNQTSLTYVKASYFRYYILAYSCKTAINAAKHSNIATHLASEYRKMKNLLVLNIVEIQVWYMQVKTSREQPKSAPYLRLKNSEWNSKCQVFSSTEPA